MRLGWAVRGEISPHFPISALEVPREPGGIEAGAILAHRGKPLAEIGKRVALGYKSNGERPIILERLGDEFG